MASYARRESGPLCQCGTSYPPLHRPLLRRPPVGAALRLRALCRDHPRAATVLVVLLLALLLQLALRPQDEGPRAVPARGGPSAGEPGHAPSGGETTGVREPLGNGEGRRPPA